MCSTNRQRNDEVVVEKEIGCLESCYCCVLGSTMWRCAGGALDTLEAGVGAKYVEFKHTHRHTHTSSTDSRD